jgi:hypothetical protein
MDTDIPTTISPTYINHFSVNTGAQKNAFIDELHAVATAMTPRWLILGDFNLIYRAEDKNNNRLN